jgi:hypothetical protein
MFPVAFCAFQQSADPNTPTCPQFGCDKPPYDGKIGSYCSKSCRDAPGVPVCVRRGCHKQAYKGQAGNYCSLTCRDRGRQSSQVVRPSSHAQLQQSQQPMPYHQVETCAFSRDAQQSRLSLRDVQQPHHFPHDAQYSRSIAYDEQPRHFSYDAQQSHLFVRDAQQSHYAYEMQQTRPSADTQPSRSTDDVQRIHPFADAQPSHSSDDVQRIHPFTPFDAESRSFGSAQQAQQLVDPMKDLTGKDLMEFQHKALKAFDAANQAAILAGELVNVALGTSLDGVASEFYDLAYKTSRSAEVIFNTIHRMT